MYYVQCSVCLCLCVRKFAFADGLGGCKTTEQPLSNARSCFSAVKIEQINNVHFRYEIKQFIFWDRHQSTQLRNEKKFYEINKFQNDDKRKTSDYGGIKFDDSPKKKNKAQTTKIVYQTSKVQNHMKPFGPLSISIILLLCCRNSFRFLFIACFFNRSEVILLVLIT